jgi:WD40 repeat protein
MAFTPDGRRLLSASRDFTVKEWDTETGRETFSFKGDAPQLRGASFSPDCRRLAGLSKMSGMTIWELPTGREVLSLKGSGGYIRVTQSAFAAGGNHLVAGVGKTVRVWEATPP